MSRLLWCILSCACTASALRVGVGISDVTGPPAEIAFMGYANLEQSGHGIHLRQFSRAFVLEDDKNATRVVFVSVDAAMMGNGVRREVLKRLQKRYGDLYNEGNVILSGTHTHSTPGGFLLDFLFDLPILGFVKETYVAYITGILKSIIIAHNNLTPARMEYGEAELLEANINRSPSSYLRNPPEERAKYKYDVDKTLAQVRFITPSDKIIGVINWFAVHPTSMNNTNKLISSDNVGYASILMEKALNGNKTLPGKGRIVCAFASTNLGDVSPNTRGPRCEFSGKVCDQEKLLCDLPKERCFASGPGRDMFESTKIIATKMFETAMKVLNQKGEDLTGPVGVIHQFVEMPKQEVPPYDPVTETFNNSATVSGCLPAMGYSFAAGTTDGPGAFDFTQGTTSSNPLWNAVRDFIAAPTNDDIKCHAPKPILLATGRAKFPYEWQPHIVSCTVIRIGGLFIAAVPGEFTTMSGRRLRNVVMKASGAKRVVLAGLSNIYSDYIATPEEYQAQRYEAASTIFGPHTLDIYLNKYVELTNALLQHTNLDPGPSPPDFSEQLITLVPPVLWDSAPWGHEFGDCVKQPQKYYSYDDVVTATFVSGHPRNSVRHGRWFAAVERQVSAADDAWTVVATDADWETRFIWRRNSKILGTSYAEIEWEIPSGTPPGTYRLHHYGNYKYILGGIYPYHGFSDSFEMGYAELGQNGQGIHLRQFARAFIFVKGDTRVVLVTAEMLAVGYSVRRQVVRNLQELYGDMYSLRNVIITGTHTHSGPGGHLVDFLLDVSILGFSSETYHAYINGITRSIVNAHNNILPARLVFGKSQVANGQMNRSPYSYDQNPAEERARYATNFDDELTQVRILKSDGNLHGVMNWFSVHVTSMNMSNHLISSDNLGYAALKLEAALNPKRRGERYQPAIVAGFFASSIGDVSPNTQGPRCEFSGRECDNQFQLCALFERCFSSGPGEDMFESTRLIGERIYQGAMAVLNSTGEELSDDLAVIHQFIDMPLETAPRYDPVARSFSTNETVTGCVPALGYSFASGTTDGANILNITQGTLTGNPLLDAIGGIVAPPTAEDVVCHAPKPILLATGRVNFPVPWHSRTVSLSLINLGGFIITGIPGEPTTMAGRRVKDVVGDVLVQNGMTPRVTVTALTNEYIHYVATFEEYQVQRYEAASTLFGPHTLNIILHKFQQFTQAALQNVSVPEGPLPADPVNSTLSLILPVVMDSAPIGSSFGDVIEQPPPTVNRGDTVSAVFVAANPRNDVLQESSHFVVERLELGQWVTIATDMDWDTIFTWERDSTVLGTSHARVQWTVPLDIDILAVPYRMHYRGASRTVMGDLQRFQGHSNNFTIV